MPRWSAKGRSTKDRRRLHGSKSSRRVSAKRSGFGFRVELGPVDCDRHGPLLATNPHLRGEVKGRLDTRGGALPRLVHACACRRSTARAGSAGRQRSPPTSACISCLPSGGTLGRRHRQHSPGKARCHEAAGRQRLVMAGGGSPSRRNRRHFADVQDEICPAGLGRAIRRAGRLRSASCSLRIDQEIGMSMTVIKVQRS